MKASGTIRRRALGSLLVIVAVASVFGATRSAFFSQAANPGDTLAVGTVHITDNDGGTAPLSLSAAQPGNSDTACMKVDYLGSLDSTVRLFADVSGTLAPYLTLTVTRGTDSSPSFDSCASFTPDSTNYIGAGNGVVFDGLLSGFPTSYAAGLVDPTSGSPETWSTSEAHSYRLRVSLVNDVAAQGQSATAVFHWEAQNQ